LSDYDQVKTEKPNLRDEQLCKEILKRFPSRYPKPRPSVKDAGATIRRNLAPARDPLKNTKVAEIAQLAVAILHELDPNVDFSAQKIRKQSELFAIKWLSKAWERNLAN
jgi:hypothetical protein